MNEQRASLGFCFLFALSIVGCSKHPPNGSNDLAGADGSAVQDGGTNEDANGGGGDGGDGGDGGTAGDAAMFVCNHPIVDNQFAIDIAPTAVSGKFTVNGATPMSTAGALTLKNTATGDSVVVASTGSATYPAVLVVPGTYDVYYTWQAGLVTAAKDVPQNTNTLVKSGFSITGATTTLDIDVAAVAVQGAVTLNKGILPGGTVSLANAAFTDRVVLGGGGVGSYGPILVIPGTYDTYYTNNDANTTSAPRNSRVRLSMGNSITSTTKLDIDVSAATVSSAITVNGAVPAGTNGIITLTNTTTGDSLRLGQTGVATGPARIVPDTFDTYFSGTGPSAVKDVPGNKNARIKTGTTITASTTTLNVDVPTASVSGHITVNGAMPVSKNGNIMLENSTTGDSIVIGSTGTATYGPTLVVAGTYEIHYGWTYNNGVPADVPLNDDARLKTGVAVTGTAALDVDVPSATVSGHVTVNGATPTSTTGNIVLVDPTNNAFRVPLATTGTPSYGPALVVPGSYDIYYGLAGPVTSSDVPRNSHALIKAGTAIAATTALDVDVHAVALSGALTINGATPVSASGSVVMTNPVTNDVVGLSVTGMPTFGPALVVSGIYDLYYTFAFNGTGTDVPRNTHALIECAKTQ